MIHAKLVIDIAYDTTGDDWARTPNELDRDYIEDTLIGAAEYLASNGMLSGDSSNLIIDMWDCRVTFADLEPKQLDLPFRKNRYDD